MKKFSIKKLLKSYRKEAKQKFVGATTDINEVSGVSSQLLGSITSLNTNLTTSIGVVAGGGGVVAGGGGGLMKQPINLGVGSNNSITNSGLTLVNGHSTVVSIRASLSDSRTAMVRTKYGNLSRFQIESLSLYAEDKPDAIVAISKNTIGLHAYHQLPPSFSIARENYDLKKQLINAGVEPIEVFCQQFIKKSVEHIPAVPVTIPPSGFNSKCQPPVQPPAVSSISISAGLTITKEYLCDVIIVENEQDLMLISIAGFVNLEEKLKLADFIEDLKQSVEYGY